MPPTLNPTFTSAEFVVAAVVALPIFALIEFRSETIFSTVFRTECSTDFGSVNFG